MIKPLITTGWEEVASWKINRLLWDFEGIKLIDNQWVKDNCEVYPSVYICDLSAIQKLVVTYKKQQEFAAEFARFYLKYDNVVNSLTKLVELSARQWCEIFLCLIEIPKELMKKLNIEVLLCKTVI